MKTIWNNSVKVSKTYKDNQEDRRIDVEIRLDDECGNGICNFAITADVYDLTGRGARWCSGGCMHDEILKVFPEFADFVMLHNCHYDGTPIYPVENGHYLLASKGVKACAEYLRIDEKTAQRLSGDKKHFKYQLFALGIVGRWKEQADKAIAHLEELKGVKWVNPYKPEEERLKLTLSDDERREVERLIAEGYYTQERLGVWRGPIPRTAQLIN